MSLTLFDLIVAVVVLVSAVLAMVRGFVREVLSVVSWVIAAVAAYYLYEALLSVIYPSPISDESVATIISVAVIFVVVLIIATYLTMKVADFVVDSRIGPLDRVLGFLFGAARGLLLVVIAFIFFTWLVPLSEQPDWIATAQTQPVLYDLGEQLIAVLPEDIEEALLEGFRRTEDGTEAAPVPEGEPAGNLAPIPDTLFPPATP